MVKKTIQTWFYRLIRCLKLLGSSTKPPLSDEKSPELIKNAKETPKRIVDDNAGSEEVALDAQPKSCRPIEDNEDAPESPPPGRGGLEETPSRLPKEAEPLGSNVPGGSSGSPEHEKEKKRRKPKAPREIGGRRTQGPRAPELPRRRPPVSRPELICRKPPGSLQWEIVLSADNECQIKEVRHNGESLDSEKGEYRLQSFAGRLSVSLNDEKDIVFPLVDDKPLIFKLSANWQNDGRKVSSITGGHFIVITPKSWNRIGHVPVECERCKDDNFIAHYFYCGNDELGADIGGFEGQELIFSKSAFKLKGSSVFDDSKMGKLFVGDAPPELTLTPDVVWARVGEEENNGWKGENFKPSDRTLAEVLDDRQGRFFIRFYDSEAKLLDSGEFRYLPDFKEIRVNGERYNERRVLLPPYTRTTVEFVGVDGLIFPVLDEEAYAEVEAKGIVVVKGHPDGDMLRCSVEVGNGSTDCIIRLPRIWWRMERDGDEFDEWRDTPLTMTRQEFRKRADANEIIRLRLPELIKSIHVGFDDELERAYYRENKENGCLLPLADFVDYSQIDQRLKEDASFQVKCSGEVLTLIRVSADPVPTIIFFTYEPETAQAGEPVTLRWTTRNAEEDGITIEPDIGAVESSGSLGITPIKTMNYTLRLTTSDIDDVMKTVIVVVNSLQQVGEKPFACARRTSGGWRRGKGFSYGELQAVGVTVAHALRRSIPIDERRRSSHSVNIEMLGRLLDV